MSTPPIHGAAGSARDATMAPLVTVRVVLADDHAMVRAGLRALVDAEPDMRVVGEAADGEAAWRAAQELAPDVLVMDLSMPVLGGAEATERVRRDCPGVRVLVLTVHEERIYLARLLRAGAAGYVLKRAAPEELVRAIRTVVAGGMYLDPAVAGVVVGGFLTAAPADGELAGSVAGDGPEAGPAALVDDDDALSVRERDVLRRIARGDSNKEIAAALGLSVKTIETYKARVADKLDLRSRAAIVRYAARRGWLSES